MTEGDALAERSNVDTCVPDPEVVRLRRELQQARRYMRAVLSSPVCHPHNAVMLRDGIASVTKALGDG